MIRFLYDLGFLVFGIASLPHFLKRLGQANDRGRCLRERFGFFPRASLAAFRERRPLWIHCVSVGEVLAVERLIRLILERAPDETIVLTTVTPTGQEVARSLEQERLRVHYFPFDWRVVVGRFFHTFQPSLLILVETEIWPNVILEAHRRKIPIGVINGRLSERSFQAFRRLCFLFRPLLEKIEFFLVQTPRDQERLTALGVDPARVRVTGNMKLDAFEFTDKETTERQPLRDAWGFRAEDQVLIGGSTHSGEESLLMRALKRLREEEKLPLKLLLAPRHIERAPKILEEAKRQGLRAVLASKVAPGGALPQPAFDILILDQLGILRRLYPLADAVFMGGSLVRHGGQNPVEPAFARRVIIHGPWVFNFQDLYQRLDEEGGALQVKTEDELVFVLKRILKSEREKEYLGLAAFETLRPLQGATRENWNRMEPYLREPVAV